MEERYNKEYEQFMKQWDKIRQLIISGDKSSLPRDMFESILSCLYGRIEESETLLKNMAGTFGIFKYQAYRKAKLPQWVGDKAKEMLHQHHQYKQNRKKEFV